MPFNPGVNFNGAALQQGFSDLGEGFARFNENKQKMDNLELSAQMLAQANPELVDPALLEKFSKGGLGQREALVGQMTAAVANKFRDRQLSQTDAAQQIQRDALTQRGEQFQQGQKQENRQFDRLHPEGWKPNFERFTQAGQDGRETSATIINNTPFSGQVVIDKDATAAPEDGAAVLDHTGQEIGIYLGGKPKLDTFKQVWRGRDQILLNERTGKTKGGEEMPQGAGPTGTTPSLFPAGQPASPQDAAALQWAQANPQDPRAAAIKQRLGVK